MSPKCPQTPPNPPFPPIPPQYLKKLHTQERAVEEVKLAIKPYYQRKDISKDEYKDILRKAVHKVGGKEWGCTRGVTWCMQGVTCVCLCRGHVVRAGHHVVRVCVREESRGACGGSRGVCTHGGVTWCVCVCMQGVTCA